MNTEQERIQFQIQCFGMTQDQLDKYIEAGLDYTDRISMSISLMSDAQEEIAMGLHEKARQTLNRAKYIAMRSRQH